MSGAWGESGGSLRQPEGVHQIDPAGVRFFDQLKLPDPLPFLDLTLAHEGRVTGLVNLEPDEQGDAMLRGEAVEVTLAMLVDPFDQIVGRAGVERPVPLAGDDVGEERQPGPPYATKALGPGFRRDERANYSRAPSSGRRRGAAC